MRNASSRSKQGSRFGDTFLPSKEFPPSWTDTPRPPKRKVPACNACPNSYALHLARWDDCLHVGPGHSHGMTDSTWDTHTSGERERLGSAKPAFYPHHPFVRLLMDRLYYLCLLHFATVCTCETVPGTYVRSFTTRCIMPQHW
jgi:hypothetical protein